VTSTGSILFLDLAQFAVPVLAVRIRQDVPGGRGFARAVRRTNEVAASPIPTRYIKEPT